MIEKLSLESRNMEIAIELGKYLEEHPEVEAAIPEHATLLVLPSFDPELEAHNRRIGQELEQRGEKVHYLAFGRMRPYQPSRLEGMVVAENQPQYGRQGE
jgi:hypothetical protein